ncbi:unnamed protein product, partial [Tetraodon nigroviridis]
TGASCKHIDHRNLFTQRMCCKRQSHFVYIGQGQQEYSKHSSMLEFLRSKKMGRRRAAAPESPELPDQPPLCGPNMACEPTGMRVERVLLFEGPREVEVIQECHCELRLSECIRVPALRTYNSETPYETVIDVGGCSQSKGGPGACERARMFGDTSNIDQ